MSQDVVNSFEGTFSKMVLGFEKETFLMRMSVDSSLKRCPIRHATKGDKSKSGRNFEDRLTALLAAGGISEKLLPFLTKWCG